MAEESYQRLHAIIHGRVQGVFFRSWTQRQAHALNLKGWVCNTSEGHVELVIEGPRSVLEEFLQQCRQGPPAAQVKDIQLEWSEAEGLFKDFEIQYGASL